jgi:hypothetical protein
MRGYMKWITLVLRGTVMRRRNNQAMTRVLTVPTIQEIYKGPQSQILLKSIFSVINSGKNTN